MALQPLNIEKCDSEYKQFYDQSGGSMIPVFQGTKYQKGHGLGSMFSGLLKAAVPMLKRGAASLGRALQTGANVARDALAGKNIKSALRDNAKMAGKQLLSESINKISDTIDRSVTPNQTRIKKKRKTSSVSRQAAAKRKRARLASPRDIFS
jgi:hypothetical protein